jgi:hypothetical protein
MGADGVVVDLDAIFQTARGLTGEDTSSPRVSNSRPSSEVVAKLPAVMRGARNEFYPYNGARYDNT